MRPKELLSRRLVLAAFLGFLFIATACAPQPAVMADEPNYRHTTVYTVCINLDDEGGCGPLDKPVPNIPATIYMLDGTSRKTVTDENGSVSFTSPDETNVNLDLALAEQTTGLCGTSARTFEEPDQTRHEITLELCDELNT